MQRFVVENGIRIPVAKVHNLGQIVLPEFSDKRLKFRRHILAADRLATDVLVRDLRCAEQAAFARAAGLRVLIARAPVSVTLGRPFAERRRLVRQHYAV